MSDILTETSGSILRLQLNRPAKKNAMTSAMYITLAELIQLGLPFDAVRAAELGLVTRVVPDQTLLATATETAQKLAEKPAAALQACKRLMKAPIRDQLVLAAKRENEEFATRVRSADAREAFTAFVEKRPPHFTGTERAGSHR